MAVVVGSSYEFGEGYGSLDTVGDKGRAMEQRAKAFYESVDLEIVRKRHEEEGGLYGRPQSEARAVPLPPECMPDRLKARTNDPLLDYAGAALYGYIKVVSGKLRAILEGAGDAGRFWPVEVLHPDGRVAEGEWFAWQVTAVLDAIDPDSEGLKFHKGFQPGGGSYRRQSGTPETGSEARSQMRVRREIIAGHAAWRELRFRTDDVFLADDAFQAMIEAGIEGWRLSVEMGEV